MSVSDQISRIITARNAIRNAISNKGVDASGAKLDELSALISLIPLPVIETLIVNANGTYTAPAGIDGYSPVKVELPTVEQATPDITVSSSGLITASATQSGGLVTAGTKSATKQLTTKGAATITPTSSVQIAVPAGTYVTGDIKVGAASTAKVKTGSFAVSVNTAKRTITHNLGVVPNFAFFSVVPYVNPTGYWDYMFAYHYRGTMVAFVDSSSSGVQTITSDITQVGTASDANVIHSATASTIVFGKNTSNTYPHFAIGSDYYWIVASI